jgi:hypothetical protein
MKYIYILLTFFLPYLSYAQINKSAEKITISGYVYDASNGESLIGSSVYREGTTDGTTTNAFGFYSLSVPAGDSLKIVYSFIGYSTQTISVSDRKNVTINIRLETSMLNTVEISGVAADKVSEGSQMSSVVLDQQTIEKIPTLLGENDVLRAIQLMPGVQSPGDAGVGFYVRGGGPDQNLILLDGVPVYNASHLFGFFSVFNTDAINRVELIKGGFPARYGGRLSSVIDIQMKEGNMKKFGVEGSVGILSGRLMVEGPIVKDKVSFMVSGRRSWFDVFSAPISKAINGNAVGYYLIDVNGKINWKINNKHRIYLSGYFGEDKLYGGTGYKDTTYRDKSKFRLSWGNITSSLRWNYNISPKLFMNTTATFTQYKYRIGYDFEAFEKDVKTEDFGSSMGSRIQDWSGRVDFNWYPAPNHKVMFGGNYTYHTFIPGTTELRLGNTKTNSGASNIFSHETQLYIEDEFKLFKRLTVNLGVHGSTFHVRNKTFWSIQPRASAGVKIIDNLAVKASYSEMAQYIHLLSNPGISLPTDLWLPVTDNIKPMLSRQIALGIFKDWGKLFSTSVEGYYKTMDNVMDYKNGANIFIADDSWEQQITQGQGESYGMEFLLRRSTGKLTGWIGYTLSWNWRKFADLNYGEKFPYRYDRRHDFEIFLNYEINKKIDISATWVYGTGNAFTYVTSGMDYANPLGGNTGMGVGFFDKRNDQRMRDYHRLDLSVNFKKDKKWGQRIWNVSIYNVYSRQNPFFYMPGTSNGTIKQVSIMPIIPSVSYIFKIR